MLTRRDLIHSRQFLRQRLLAALAVQKADPLDWSGRRMGGATFFSVMVTAVAFAAVGIYALIVPGGNTRWQACDAPIVEKETGAVFVCDTGRGEILFPIANFASARLFHPDHHDHYLINAASLDWPRIGLFGIDGAPDNLPTPKHLTTDPWTMCSRVSADGAGVSILFAGLRPGGGRDLGDEAVLVADPQGGKHLIWRGRRHQIRDDLVLTALRVPSLPPLPVALAWLDTLPLGPEFSKIDIAGASEPVTWHPSIKVGQVVYVGDQLHAAVDKESLSRITDLQARLLIAAYPAANPGPPSKLDELSGIGKTKPPLQTRLPDTAPTVQPVSTDGGLCATAADATDARAVRAGVPMRQFSPRPGPPAPVPLADVVLVSPSRGILVEARSSAGATGALFLITDQSMGYRISSPESAKRLGYEGAAVVDLPTALVARVPLGPDLDHNAAGNALARKSTG